MSSLYQILDDVLALDKLLEEAGGDVTEGTPGETLEKWAREFDWKQREKVDSYCKLIRNWEADIEAIQGEMKRLADRQRMLANRIERLKALAKFAMLQHNTKKLEGVTFTMAIQKNGGKDPIEIKVEDVEKYPAHLIKVIKQIDKEALRTALESNDPEAEKLARLGERGESVRIR